MGIYSKSSDQELVSLIKDNVELAYTEVYLRYWKSVFLTAQYRLDDKAVAEELVQDVFCNFWNRRHTFELKSTLNAYFSVSLKYEIINHLVKKKRKRDYLDYQKSINNLEDFSTIHTIYVNDLLSRLESSISLLPERCQLVFRLRFEKDFSQRQISQELKIAEKTVEAHLAKARKHIRASLHSLSPYFLLYLFEYFLQ